jgi:nucleotide-binding universal stress UspA family protein
MYKHIMIPTDGSALSRMAIEHGIALAKPINARVTAVTVTVPFHVFLSLGWSIGLNNTKNTQRI